MRQKIKKPLRGLLVAASLALAASFGLHVLPEYSAFAQAQAPELAPQPTPAPQATPTEADAALAQRFDAIYQKLDASETPARETLNALRSRQLMRFRDVLKSREPLNAFLLYRARRTIKSAVWQMEIAAKIAAPAPSSIAVRRSAVAIDGRLDEAAWKNAAPIPIAYDRFGKTASLSHVRLLWDERFLYAGFEVEDANIIAPKLERDGELWKYDCVEFFLMPDKTAREYWEVEISPSGGLYDALCKKHFSHWGADMKTEAPLKGLQIGRTVRGTPNKTNDRDEGYTVEVAIPWSQLPNFKAPAHAGSCFYGLFCTISRDSDAANARIQPLAQTPYVSWFHNIWVYQYFVLEAR